jgi:regulator of protease activity HflC (stomatin/prohibitin superfamily)
MNTKEEIVLKVPLDVAETYRKATDKEQAQIAARLSVMLRSQLTKEAAIAKLNRTMDNISEQAQARGLTPEILESILNDDK